MTVDEVADAVAGTLMLFNGRVSRERLELALAEQARGLMHDALTLLEKEGTIETDGTFIWEKGKV